MKRKTIDIRKLALIKIRKQLTQEKSRRDLIIGKVVDSIENLDKVINSLYIRLASWYSLYFPELWQKERDLEKFVKIVAKKGFRDKIEGIDSKNTIGGDLKEEDVKVMMKFANKILSLIKEREDLEKYLKKIMRDMCPNLSEVAGEKVGAKLIRKAGSLRKLSKLPASTIQVLGAEKALFAHIRRKKKVPSPKHGFIYLNPLVRNAPKKVRGKIARRLANKISLAVKVDYFDEGKKNIGKKLREEIEEEAKKIIAKYKKNKK